MTSQLTFDKPHRRYNPLSGEYVLVSARRANRPWQGQVEKVPDVLRPSYDPNCYLCPGNARAGGQKNPDYSATFVFTNDFPSLLDQSDVQNQVKGSGLIQAYSVRGTNRVICFSPRHDLTLPLMSIEELSSVVDTWCAQTLELGQRYPWVQLFQNQGEMMGASNPHPHGQVWAVDSLPNEPQREDSQQENYSASNRSNLLLDYLQEELALGERVVLNSRHWAVVVPFWAIWPFETVILPKRHTLRMPDLKDEERKDLAVLLKQLMIGYDNLFEVPFPYSMGWHGAPYADGDNGHWQLHAHVFPPLLRSATVRKFMVGYELLAEAQRDLSPEQAARRLTELPTIHYSQRAT